MAELPIDEDATDEPKSLRERVEETDQGTLLWIRERQLEWMRWFGEQGCRQRPRDLWRKPLRRRVRWRASNAGLAAMGWRERRRDEPVQSRRGGAGGSGDIRRLERDDPSGRDGGDRQRGRPAEVIDEGIERE